MRINVTGSLPDVTWMDLIRMAAEYGIDPLKTGRLLRLTGITESDSNARGLATPVQAGVCTLEPGTYKIDAEHSGLHPGEGFDIEYHMPKGATIVFAWKADGPLQFEFHGEPDKTPKPGYYESYLLNNEVGLDHFDGSFTAPTTGVLGWFWRNKTQKNVRMYLAVSGFSDSARMYDAGAPSEELLMENAKCARGSTHVRAGHPRRC